MQRHPPGSRALACQGRPNGPRRHLTLRGSRADALEYLPPLDVRERLELSADRIRLVSDAVRVDVRILGETGGPEAPHETPLTLLELAFEGRSEHEADDYVRRYRRRARIASACH